MSTVLYRLSLTPSWLEPSKAALKNKKKRARKHARSEESSAEWTEAAPLESSAEVTKPAPLVPGSSPASPLDLLKVQIEEAKANKVS